MTESRQQTDFQKVLALVGPEVAAVLCEEFGGTHVYIPKKRTVTRRLREQGIYNDRKAGMSYRDIARKWDMTKGGAYKLCVRVEKQLAEEAAKKKGGEADGTGTRSRHP